MTEDDNHECIRVPVFLSFRLRLQLTFQSLKRGEKLAPTDILLIIGRVTGGAGGAHII
jgi:hypothetical protein